MSKRQLYDDLLSHDVGAAVERAAALLDVADGHGRVPGGRRRAARAPAAAVLTTAERQ